MMSYHTALAAGRFFVFCVATLWTSSVQIKSFPYMHLLILGVPVVFVVSQCHVLQIYEY